MNGSNPAPIFIVGAPRSGTTLLQQILNRHPAIGICHETFFFYYVFDRRRVFGDLADSKNRARVTARYLETRRVGRLGLDHTALADRLMAEGTSYPRLFESLLRFHADRQGKRRFGEKTPQHALRSKVLIDWYPDCRLIHLVRDPRDVAASLSTMPWGGGDALTNTRTWRLCVEGAEEVSSTPNCLRVRYEDLIADPAAQLSRMLKFIGENPADGMLEPNSADGGSDRWWFERARGPITRGRLESWRTKLSPSEIAVVEWVAGEWLDRFGYPRESAEPRAMSRAWANGTAAANAVVRRARSLPAVWYRWIRPDQLAAEEAWLEGD